MGFNTNSVSKLSEKNIDQIKEEIADTYVTASIEGESESLADDAEFGFRYIVGNDGQPLSDVEWLKKENGVTLYGADTGFYIRVNATTGEFESGFNTMSFISKFHRTTDAKNNVMVYTPLYYIKELFIGLYKEVWFCEAEKDGYRPAAFCVRPDGSVSDHVLIGAYEMCNSTPGRSLSGMPYETEEKDMYSGYTRAQYREYAKQNGEGYGLRTVAVSCDLFQKLMTLYFGTRDIQTYVAGICSLVDGPFDSMYEGDVHYTTGMTDSVPNYNGIKKAFENNPSGSNYNGAGFNNGANPFVWLGFENPYGCLEEFDDGLNFYNGVAYVTNDMSIMAENTVEGYEKLSYSLPSGDGGILAIGYDAAHPWAQLPTKVDVDSDGATYFADWYYPPSTSGYRLWAVGVGCDDYNDVGVFARDCSLVRRITAVASALGSFTSRRLRPRKGVSKGETPFPPCRI